LTGRRAGCWAVIPAAGVGRRFGAARPKQYLDLAGRPVIEHAMRPLLGHPRIRGLVVALDPADAYWADTQLAADPRVRRAAGGAERCHSVLNALELLATEADPEDWVLVHDAARPCLRAADLDRLIATLEDDPVGGLLGVPVRDTMKESDDSGRSVRTLPRARLWHAYTPQMFRLGLLRRALRGALEAGHLVTDDASAVELLGLAPRLVEGQADNIKITRVEDLGLARFYLQEQGR
jgi:2-C-methyl-D-erythritol 4-phosphate cytidylyltransferase